MKKILKSIKKNFFSKSLITNKIFILIMLQKMNTKNSNKSGIT